MFNKVTKEYQKERSEQTRDNAKALIEHMNIASIRQFGEVIGAPESSVSRWIRKTGVQGVQPGYFFWLVYEAFGMFGVEVLFTGNTKRAKADVKDLLKQMSLMELVELQGVLAEQMATMARGNTADVT